MQRLEGEALAAIRPYFEAAAEVAKQATCHRAHCGTVIVKDKAVIGEGYNGPARALESNRTCNAGRDYSIKPKYDKTCCIHAEWRAILNACKRSGNEVEGARLYFMRVDEQGNFTDAGQPFCTVCSRLTLESGIKEFALWNDGGADVYEAAEYDRVSYAFYHPA